METVVVAVVVVPSLEVGSCCGCGFFESGSGSCYGGVFCGNSGGCCGGIRFSGNWWWLLWW